MKINIYFGELKFEQVQQIAAYDIEAFFSKSTRVGGDLVTGGGDRQWMQEQILGHIHATSKQRAKTHRFWRRCSNNAKHSSFDRKAYKSERRVVLWGHFTNVKLKQSNLVNFWSTVSSSKIQYFLLCLFILLFFVRCLLDANMWNLFPSQLKVRGEAHFPQDHRLTISVCCQLIN